MRRRVTALLTIALVAIGVSSAAAARPHVSVYFLQGEQLAPVTRVGTVPLVAVRQLIAGPTEAERRRGFRTYVPAGTRVLSVTVLHGTATVDLNERFASGGSPASLLARLSQFVRTLTGLQGARRVQLLMNGGPVAAPPGCASDRGQRRRAHDRRFDREAVDSDSTRGLSRLRQDPALVVDAISRVAAVGTAVRRWHRLSRVARRPGLPRVPRLRPPILHGRQVGRMTLPTSGCRSR